MLRAMRSLCKMRCECSRSGSCVPARWYFQQSAGNVHEWVLLLFFLFRKQILTCSRDKWCINSDCSVILFREAYLRKLSYWCRAALVRVWKSSMWLETKSSIGFESFTQLMMPHVSFNGTTAYVRNRRRYWLQFLSFFRWPDMIVCICWTRSSWCKSSPYLIR